MTCTSPLKALRLLGENKLLVGTNKDWPNPGRRTVIEDLHLPCGQCTSCRLQRSKQWAIRCVHEAQLHAQNCFITLTFAPEHLPDPPTVRVRDFQLFMKRLRKKFGAQIRFFHCGEYGSKNRRPHYHAILFGFQFPDLKLWKITKTGERLFISAELSKLWPFGFSTVGDCTFQSAAYVARYIVKKHFGKDAADYYFHSVDSTTGEVIYLHPEYTTMSRKPGIASGWLDQYLDDVYPGDFVIMRGKRHKPPRYYDKRLQLVDPYEYDEVVFTRYEEAQKHLDDSTQERLNDVAVVVNSRLRNLPRPYEDGIDEKEPK